MAQIYLEIQVIKHERQVPPKAALGSEVCSMGDIHGPHISVILAFALLHPTPCQGALAPT